jgi:DNA polymerase kappa
VYVKAKIEFPEQFHSSPTRDAERAPSENDAARSAAEALEEVALREDTKESDEGKANDIVNLNRGIANSKIINISSVKIEC